MQLHILCLNLKYETNIGCNTMFSNWHIRIRQKLTSPVTKVFVYIFSVWYRDLLVHPVYKCNLKYLWLMLTLTFQVVYHPSKLAYFHQTTNVSPDSRNTLGVFRIFVLQIDNGIHCINKNVIKRCYRIRTIATNQTYSHQATKEPSKSQGFRFVQLFNPPRFTI